MNGPALVVTGLSVTYPGGAAAVRGVDLHVEAGECLAVVGESGCGKTTLATAVLGLLPPGTTVTGSVRVTGTEVVGAPPRALRRLRGRAVGLVAQDPYAACDPLRRVRDHVAEAWRAHGARPPPGAVVSRLARLGIPAAERTARRHPHEWSGGMLQRATVAAAAAHAPALLVADEPTTALDADRAHSVLTDLRATGAALLLISHDLGVVAAHADRIAVCYAGRVVETGSSDAVLARPGHPYTEALLASVPRRGAGLPRALPGAPPAATSPVTGCPFAPRCPEAEAACRAALPPLIDGVACLRRAG